MPDNDLLDLVMGRGGNPDPALEDLIRRLKDA
jgi:succinate dehydrogenase flavin-adding protein (antitoxin of CptAB toxin-antitoxin module)